MLNVDGRYSDLHQNHLSKCAPLLENHVANAVRDLKYIDRVSARAKTVKSFVNKTKKTNRDGTLKYTDPFEQVQDMLGARVVVFYPQTVMEVNHALSTYYTTYEEADKQPESLSEFGYEGKHFLFRIPADIIPEDAPSEFPECFELQIKTLFQHAFSETTHDLVYKPGLSVSNDQKRRAAFAAASAWGADQVLRQFVEELLPNYPSNDN